MARSKTYNHVFGLMFQINGSTDTEGGNLTQDELRAAILTRVDALCANNELVEAVGLPVESLEEN